MKWLLFFVCLCFACCTIEVHPIKDPQKKKTVKRSHSVHHKPAPATRAAHKSITVDAQWIATYRRMESDHGGYTIPEDAHITMGNDGRYIIPKSVQEHFEDMVKATH